MLHQGREKKQVASLHRWKSERGGLFRDRGPSGSGRSFDEDLALFERQVLGEAQGRGDGNTGFVSYAALSA